jgi:ectoine hydroxylase-related dioxygenase (phytanoyl-CoA dioxygenase family)
MPTAVPAVPAATLPTETCARYERDGFAICPGFLPAGEMERYRLAALAYADQRKAVKAGEAFRQLCQVWREDAVLRELTFDPRITAAVSQLAGRPMRLYHDQILIKDPRNGQASEFHQDRPYWPLTEGPTVSIWLALGDCPVESGCMSFLPGSHRRTGTPLQVLTWARDLFEKCPELEWSERVVAPLRAGGITFHQGWTAHRAQANETDRARVAFSAIYVDATVQLGKGENWPYPGAKAGQVLSDEGCPRIN